jgi:esterase/lipase
MKIKISRVRYRGILINLCYSNLNKPQKVIILAYGLPGAPPRYKEIFIKKLVKAGFMIAIPNYIGTFDSEGLSNIENSVDTIIKTIKLIKKGKTKELYWLKDINWKTKEIILIGESFGGSVVLVAGAKSKDINKIIAIAPPTDYRTQGKLDYEEEKIMDDYMIMKRAYPFTWRFESKDTWLRFDKGELDLNPIDYINKLKSKKILIIHGLKDKVVNIERSKQLFKKLKNNSKNKKLVILEKEGHIGLSSIKKRKIFKEIISWIS